MRARGFTMVELLIAMAIAAILLMLVMPTYAEFMRNTRIRNTADSLAGGIRLAQAEAIRRNQNVELIVDPANGWSIRDPITPSILHNEPFSDTGGQIIVDPSVPPAVKLTYSPLGQLILPTNPDDGSTTMTSIAVRHAVAPSRELTVITDVFGAGVRVCDNDDPTVNASLRCPPGVP
jgi:prepilin-type N-terminal cleavage/methylation domain-containing protein